MWLDDYRWHYDYVRLAWDTGFSFGNYNHKHSNFEKINCLVDVELVIRERDFASLERYLPIVVQYILDSDQAGILDTNFVKIFRISQLSIEYLLFCKKYLDNTVVLLKKDIFKLKQEIKEIKLYTEELENHISVLTKHNLVTTFKCEKCPKVFSAEEYLNSHLKRKHSEQKIMTVDLETNKLHSEIKELKERLNITEKLLQERTESDQFQNKHDDNEIVADIQKKFNKFKEHVENEIANLQMEKTFYEDKYGKLFDVVVQHKSSSNINLENNEEIKDKEKSILDIDKEKVENGTQTDNLKINKFKQETVQNISIYDFKDSNDNVDSSSEKNIYINDTIEEKMNAFSENIESKISSGLLNIESQMQTFWEKLTAIEENKNKLASKQNIQSPLPVHESSYKTSENTVVTDEVHRNTATADKVELVKPKIKPRTKFFKPSSLPDAEHSRLEAEKIKKQLDEFLCSPKKEPEVQIVKSVGDHFEQHSSETEDSSEVNVKETVLLEKENTVKKSVVSSALKEDAPQAFLEEVNEILQARLQANGDFPACRGISKQIFEKAMKIMHSHNMDFNRKITTETFRKSVGKVVKKDHLKLKNPKKTNMLSKQKEEKPSVIKIHYRRKSNQNKPKPSLGETPVIAIKNRSLYDTDSENEVVRHHNPHVEKTQVAVIEELKSRQARSLPAKMNDTDSDLTSAVLSNDDKNEVQTKSALKNYPSDGSLVKKRVLFDVEAKKKHFNSRENESISSISIGKRTEEKKEDKSASSSDFELSEL